MLYQLIILLINNLKNVEFIKFKEDCSKTGTTEEALANADKIGFKTNLFAEHPFNKEIKIPIYFANFVLMDYGNGSNFGCQLMIKEILILLKNINFQL